MYRIEGNFVNVEKLNKLNILRRLLLKFNKDKLSHVTSGPEVSVTSHSPTSEFCQSILSLLPSNEIRRYGEG
jgi:hypothetical protein